MADTKTPENDAGVAGYEKLYREVYVPTFFEKLASAGYRFATNEQAEQALRFGTQLRAQAEEDAVKTAAAGGDLLTRAEQRFNAQFGKQADAQDADDRELAAMAQKIASVRPDLVAAAVDFQNAYATGLQQQA